MALIECKNCGKQVSDRAKVCPGCGTILIEDEPQPEKVSLLCEECGAEIPEGAESCPSCGCPVPASEEPTEGENPQKVEISKVSLPKMQGKTKKIIIVVAAIAVLAAVIAILAAKSHQKKAMESYEDTLSLAVTSMLLGASEAEDAGNLIHDVWYNTIYEKSSSTTDKYTRRSERGSYYDDFNTSLSNLFADEEFQSQVSAIKSNQDLTASYMKQLTNPPDEYKEAYDAVKKFYDAYLELTNLAIDPTGNLTTYTSNFNNADTATLNAYKAAKLYIED